MIVVLLVYKSVFIILFSHGYCNALLLLAHSSQVFITCIASIAVLQSLNLATATSPVIMSHFQRTALNSLVAQQNTLNSHSYVGVQVWEGAALLWDLSWIIICSSPPFWMILVPSVLLRNVWECTVSRVLELCVHLGNFRLQELGRGWFQHLRHITANTSQLINNFCTKQLSLGFLTTNTEMVHNFDVTSDEFNVSVVSISRNYNYK